MKYNFDKFNQQNTRTESRITITKSNSFGFPTKFSEDNNIKEYNYVVLYYDDVKKAIGIHFTNDEKEPHKFSIIKSEKYGASLVAQSFFKTNSINTKKYHNRYNWKKVKLEDVGTLFVIELDNPKMEEDNK